MANYLPKILIVDDRPENLLAMTRLLAKSEAELYTAASGNEALALIIDPDFALILLDVQMPEMDGFETAEIMRSSDYAKTVQIIFVTAISKEQQHIFQGYDSGAVDYMFKPVEPKILRSKVAVFLQLDRQKKDLEMAREELTRQKIAIEDMAIHDELTGLYNRRHLNKLLQQEFARCNRYGADLSCMMIDLDHFKQVNDTPMGMVLAMWSSTPLPSGLMRISGRQILSFALVGKSLWFCCPILTLLEQSWLLTKYVNIMWLKRLSLRITKPL
ncbi:MAG: response regulator [Candidatus Thiodiazotropha sp. (ex Lucinoma kastoroae)]|nr:response regulator [Candidatus Thiodiazotropha sp. (ex Lucinoma kastoroae)]